MKEGGRLIGIDVDVGVKAVDKDDESNVGDVEVETVEVVGIKEFGRVGIGLLLNGVKLLVDGLQTPAATVEGGGEFELVTLIELKVNAEDADTESDADTKPFD